jgi:hypothetical protein
MNLTIPVQRREPRSGPADPQATAWRRLNGLQRMMVRWELFQPLNAAHVVELAGGISAERLIAGISTALFRHLPGPLEISSSGNHLRFVDWKTRECPTLTVECRPSLLKGLSAVHAILGQQLNIAFPAGVHWPVRFHLITSADQRTFLAVTYRHAVADSRSISALLRTLFRSARGEPDPADLLDLAPDLHQILPDFQRWTYPLRVARQLWKEFLHGAVSWRAHDRHPTTGLVVTGGGEDNLPTALLKETARRYQATVQELFVAALLDAFAELLPQRPNRLRFGIYTPVDLRAETVPPVPEAFGQILGGYTLRLRRPRSASFAQLVKTVTKESAVVKQQQDYRLYEQHLRFTSHIWDRLPEAANRLAGPLIAPVAALASNVNLGQFLSEEIACGQILGYTRFTGTGIMTSMMAGLTTLGDAFNLTMTTRDDLYSPEEMHTFRRHLQHRLLGQ